MSARSALLLVMGVAVFGVGVMVATSPIPTSIGIMCEDGACAALETVPLPALGLGSTIIVLGIAIFAWGMNTEPSGP